MSRGDRATAQTITPARVPRLRHPAVIVVYVAARRHEWADIGYQHCHRDRAGRAYGLPNRHHRRDRGTQVPTVILVATAALRYRPSSSSRPRHLVPTVILVAT